MDWESRIEDESECDGSSDLGVRLPTPLPPVKETEVRTISFRDSSELLRYDFT